MDHVSRDSKKKYTASEAAQLVGVSYSTIRNHIREGKLNAQRDGRCLRIAFDDLAALYPDFPDSNGARQNEAEKNANPAPDDANTIQNSVNGNGENNAFLAEDSANTGVHSDNSAMNSVNALRAENESLRDERDRLRDEMLRLRTDWRFSQEQLQDALGSIRALTEQNERLTLLLANEQAQRMKALPRPFGWIRKLFGRQTEGD